MSEEHVAVQVADPVVEFDIGVLAHQFVVNCTETPTGLTVDVLTPATGVKLDIDHTVFEIAIPGTVLPAGTETHEHAPVTKTLTYDSDERLIRVVSSKTDKSLSYDTTLPDRLRVVTDGVKGWTKTLNYADDLLVEVVVT